MREISKIVDLFESTELLGKGRRKMGNKKRDINFLFRLLSLLRDKVLQI
jgi:hypothetical protein